MGEFHRQQLAVVFLTLLFTCCVAPRCFSCKLNDQRCGDHFGLPNTDADFCDGTCVKMRGERYSDSVRIVEVTRMCIEQRDEGCYDTTWNGISVEACACNTDYCNAGTTVTPLPYCSGYSLYHFKQGFLAAAVCWIHKLFYHMY